VPAPSRRDWRVAEVEVRSRLDAPPARVWDRIATFEGVNAELRPLLRMTAPRGVEALESGDVVLGERMFRSWILLFGVIPFDYDDLTLVRIDPGRGFLERSPMLSMRLWEHERTLEPDDRDGCLVIDRLRFEPRLPLPGALPRPAVGLLFRHRHRRLRAHFGGEPR
jgi:ligand-binding SRPBCC domain-containing protein